MLIKTNCLSQLLKVRSDESNFQLVSPTNQQTNLTWELLVKKGFLSNWKYKQRCKYSLMNRCIVSRSAIFWKTSSCAPSNRQREQKCMKSFCKLQSLPYGFTLNYCCKTFRISTMQGCNFCSKENLSHQYVDWFSTHPPFFTLYSSWTFSQLRM